MAFEAPNFVYSQVAVGTIIPGRVIVCSGAGAKLSTAVPASARPIGVSLEAATTGRMFSYAASGIVKVEASTAALARGVYVSATSGAASTGNTQLGGTVKATTALANSIGVALSSAAAAAAGNKRFVSVQLFL